MAFEESHGSVCGLPQLQGIELPVGRDHQIIDRRRMLLTLPRCPTTIVTDSNQLPSGKWPTRSLGTPTGRFMNFNFFKFFTKIVVVKIVR
jgi:hypothetical protein